MYNENENASIFSDAFSSATVIKEGTIKKCINRVLGFDIDVFDALYFRKLC